MTIYQGGNRFGNRWEQVPKPCGNSCACVEHAQVFHGPYFEQLSTAIQGAI